MTVRLFEPIQIDKLKLANRIVIAPMCQYSATPEGVMTDWHTIHLGHLALSGAGLLIIEASAVEAVGRISSRDSGLYSDACERGLARVLEAVRANSAMPIAIQLAHAGRKASHKVPWEGSARLRIPPTGGCRTYAPAAVPFMPDEEAPLALDRDGLDRVKAAFKQAAKRSVGLRPHALHNTTAQVVASA